MIPAFILSVVPDSWQSGLIDTIITGGVSAVGSLFYTLRGKADKESLAELKKQVDKDSEEIRSIVRDEIKGIRSEILGLRSDIMSFTRTLVELAKK